MRSVTSRRLRSHGSHRHPVEAIARLIDEHTFDDPGHLAIHVDSDEGEGETLGIRALEPGVHPFAALAGFVAPAEWSMFGLRVRGWAHPLGGGQLAAASSTTFLLSRDGAEWSLLRRGRGVEELPGRAMGTIPDLCRRVLDLPTAPAPPSTALLWSVAWLDRVLETWGDPHRRRSLTASWAEVAALHPAATAVAGPGRRGLEDPLRVVALGRALTEAWPWARLRAEPGVLTLPGGDLPVEITRWMDDGFYARWALGTFPAPATLAHDLAGLLGEELGRHLVDTLDALLHPLS
ncbi:MAG: hypothetical protein ABWZ76_13890 [Acidimicrobiales bacterium]